MWRWGVVKLHQLAATLRISCCHAPVQQRASRTLPAWVADVFLTGSLDALARADDKDESGEPS